MIRDILLHDNHHEISDTIVSQHHPYLGTWINIQDRIFGTGAWCLVVLG